MRVCLLRTTGKGRQLVFGPCKGHAVYNALVTLEQNINHFTVTYNKKYANQVIEGVKTVKKA